MNELKTSRGFSVTKHILGAFRSLTNCGPKTIAEIWWFGPKFGGSQFQLPFEYSFLSQQGRTMS